MKLVIHTDGGGGVSKSDTIKGGDAAAAFVARTEDDRYLGAQATQLTGTSNMAEYTGVLLALRALPQLMMAAMANTSELVTELEFRCDSQLIVRQLTGEYAVADGTLHALRDECVALLELCGLPYTITWITRNFNKEADRLCTQALAGVVKTDLWTALPERLASAVHRESCGQEFRRIGVIAKPRPMRADAEGYALCNGCAGRLRECLCAMPETIAVPDDETETSISYWDVDVPWETSETSEVP